MNIVDQIEQDLKEAMKAKTEIVVSTLRMARSAFKNKQIDLGHEVTNEEAAIVLRSLVKQYRDALVDFTAAGRTDLMEKQKTEIELLERYLPAGISEAEIESIAKNVIDGLGDEPKDFGRIMGAVMKVIAGRADGNAVRDVVQKIVSA